MEIPSEVPAIAEMNDKMFRFLTQVQDGSTVVCHPADEVWARNLLETFKLDGAKVTVNKWVPEGQVLAVDERALTPKFDLQLL